jgi:hypothetical protein
MGDTVAMVGCAHMHTKSYPYDPKRLYVLATFMLVSARSPLSLWDAVLLPQTQGGILMARGACCLTVGIALATAGSTRYVCVEHQLPNYGHD